MKTYSSVRNGKTCQYARTAEQDKRYRYNAAKNLCLKHERETAMQKSLTGADQEFILRLEESDFTASHCDMNTLNQAMKGRAIVKISPVVAADQPSMSIITVDQEGNYSAIVLPCTSADVWM